VYTTSILPGTGGGMASLDLPELLKYVGFGSGNVAKREVVGVPRGDDFAVVDSADKDDVPPALNCSVHVGSDSIGDASRWAGVIILRFCIALRSAGLNRGLFWFSHVSFSFHLLFGQSSVAIRILLVIAGPLFTRQRHDAHRLLFASYLPHSFDWHIARIRSTSSSERRGRPAFCHLRNAAAYLFASSHVIPRTSAASWASFGFAAAIPLPRQLPVGGRSPSRRTGRVMPQTEHFHRVGSVGSGWNLQGII